MSDGSGGRAALTEPGDCSRSRVISALGYFGTRVGLGVLPRARDAGFPAEGSKADRLAGEAHLHGRCAESAVGRAGRRDMARSFRRGAILPPPPR
jgi:hypothetical protein